MTGSTLYCSQCGRDFRTRAPAEGYSLACAACGAPLVSSREAVTGTAAKDQFQGTVVGGAKLGKEPLLRPEYAVYRGVHKGLGGDVRVFVFPAGRADRDPYRVQALFRRAALTRDIRSPDVVTVLDLGRRKDCYFIMTEHCPSSLRERLEKEGRLGVNRALALAESVLTGLEEVEAAGVGHGNVTPEGILFGADGLPRLDHLGTAPDVRELNRLLVTVRGGIAGPAFYAAPETMAAGGGADVRSDLYSLGATMYEMLSGRPPYDGFSAAKILAKHVQEPVPDLRQARPDLPAELCLFVGRLMAKAPPARPAGPRAALDELREIAVELSREQKIKPVKAATAAGRTHAAVKWTIAWTAISAALIVLTAIPFVWLYRNRQRKKLAAQQAVFQAPRRVAVVLESADPGLKNPLSPEKAAAVRALIFHYLAFWPEIEPVDPSLVRELQETGASLEDVAEKVDAANLLVAVHEQGFERRKWKLTFFSREEEPWAVRAEGFVADSSPDDLSGLEAAARDLLLEAAPRLELEARRPPLTGGDGRAWRQMAEAEKAEFSGRWEDATAHAQQAQALAPGCGQIAALAFFYGAIAEAKATGDFLAAPLFRREDLAPEMAAFADALAAMAQKDSPTVEALLGEHLARCPRSARGYFLLGMWRLHGLGRPDEAAPALKHAAEIDPRYMPAAFAYVELLAGRDPVGVDNFLKDYEQRARDKKWAYRVERHAARLSEAAGPKEEGPAQ